MKGDYGFLFYFNKVVAIISIFWPLVYDYDLTLGRLMAASIALYFFIIGFFIFNDEN